MIKFYFVRHGMSTANKAGIIADGSYELAAEGKEQAKKAGAELLDFKITKILCSPYIRARQTAEIIAEVIGVEADSIIAIGVLRERGLGLKEGKPKDEENDWYITADTQSKIEPKQALIDRTAKSILYIKEYIEAGEVVLVVGHAVAGYYLRQIAKGYSDFSEFDDYHHMNNADYVEVEIRNNAEVL